MNKQEHEALRLCVESLDQLLPYLAKVPADVGLLNEALVAARPLLKQEPAPAQGEREAKAWPALAGIGRDSGHPRAVVLYLRHEPSDEHLRMIQEALRTRPAQTEQPSNPALVADLYEIGGKLLEIAHTKTKAVSTTLMAPHRDYTLKDARATALVMGERLVGMADRLVRAAPIAQTEQQPEQSRMAEALGAFVSLAEERLGELGALSPEMAECLANGRAALSAQGESHE